MSHDDFDFEPVPGLPARLPEGERMLWQGSPQRASLARRLFKVRWIGVYFGVLAVWGLVTAFYDGTGMMAAGTTVAGLAGLGVAAIALWELYAWLIGRTSIYTITDKRIVMRIGVALPITFNIPFKTIKTASLKPYPDGTGDIPVTLREGEKIAYVHLWPHARPWRFAKPEPMLRCIPEATRVADLLAQAMTEARSDEAAAAPNDRHADRTPEAAATDPARRPVYGVREPAAAH
jgi:hypothetical protein